MARCGCGGNKCTCQVVAGDNVTVTGTGSLANPFVIAAAVECETIRECLSAGPGIVYNEDTGVISATAVVEPNVQVGCGLDGSGSEDDPLSILFGVWPFPCDLDTSGSFLYCDSSNAMRAAPPGGFDRVVQQTQTAYPDLLVPVPTDTIVETQQINIVNPSDCYPAFVLVEQEIEVDLDLPSNSTANYGIGTDDMVYRFNNGPTLQTSVHLQVTKVVSRIIPPGGNLIEPINVTMGRGSGGARYNRIQTWLQAFIFNLS